MSSTYVFTTFTTEGTTTLYAVYGRQFKLFASDQHEAADNGGYSICMQYASGANSSATSNLYVPTWEEAYEATPERFRNNASGWTKRVPGWFEIDDVDGEGPVFEEGQTVTLRNDAFDEASV